MEYVIPRYTGPSLESSFSHPLGKGSRSRSSRNVKSCVCSVEHVIGITIHQRRPNKPHGLSSSQGADLDRQLEGRLFFHVVDFAVLLEVTIIEKLTLMLRGDSSVCIMSTIRAPRSGVDD